MEGFVFSLSSPFWYGKLETWRHNQKNRPHEKKPSLQEEVGLIESILGMTTGHRI